MNRKSLMYEQYQNLINSIIIQAAEDYRVSQQKLKKDPKSYTSLKLKSETELFFHSEWYRDLTRISPSLILNKIDKEEGVY